MFIIYVLNNKSGMKYNIKVFYTKVIRKFYMYQISLNWKRVYNFVNSLI